ncbi:MAG: hypothetical protein QM639_04375 [Rhodocyclaceae bacterium]
MAAVELTADENERARQVWAQMPADMREFVAQCVALGMIEGRRGLAQCKVAPVGALPGPDRSTVVSLAEIEILSVEERKQRDAKCKHLAW